ncbi:MAG: hypothetical protein JWM74_3301 [Myxococcaceae bacterium]|jgi:hypothetical protein|nr:hypothetical protein [Myxococcaceae bacterium]
MARRIAGAPETPQEPDPGRANRRTEAPPFDLATFAAEDARAALYDESGILTSGAVPRMPTSEPRSMPRPTMPDDPFMAVVREAYERRDYDGAIKAAQDILAIRPDDPDATMYANESRTKLEALYAFSMGSRYRIPALRVPREILRSRNLDHQVGFVLSLIDGRSSVEEILDLCPLPAPEVLKMLFDLVEYGTIEVR